PVIIGDFVVHEKGLTDWARIRHARGFDDDTLEVEFTLLPAHAQDIKRTHQIATNSTTYAAVAQFDNLFLGVLYQQVVVDAFRAELVFYDGDAFAVIFSENAL